MNNVPAVCGDRHKTDRMEIKDSHQKCHFLPQ